MIENLWEVGKWTNEKNICIYLSLILALSLCACGNAQTNEPAAEANHVSTDLAPETDTDTQEAAPSQEPIQFAATSSYDLDAQKGDPGIAIYDGDVIPDKETAIAVANAIRDGMQLDFLSRPYQVLFDTTKEIWVVCFYAYEVEEGSEYRLEGNSFDIALDKKGGQVLNIRFYE